MFQVGDKVQYSKSGLSLPGEHRLRVPFSKNHRGVIVAIQTEYYGDSCAVVQWSDETRTRIINKEYIEIESENADLERLAQAYDQLS